jgi:1,4-alpha-glucan branching enzyme
MAAKGYFTFVLNAHLPYVMGRNSWPLGTNWVYGAACETYIPLLDAFNRLAESGKPPKATISLSPVLCEQLADQRFKAGLLEYIDNKIRAAYENKDGFTQNSDDESAELAKRWSEIYESLRRDFIERYDNDIVGGFRALQDAGAVEIMTCAATHAYLPLVGKDETVRLQLKVAKDSYKRYFGRDPRGIWLPECAYRPAYEWRYPMAPFSDRKPLKRKGLEQALAAEGLEYFIVDAHMLRGGNPLGTYAGRFGCLNRTMAQMDAKLESSAGSAAYTTYRPYSVGDPNARAACFVRDPETGPVICNGKGGYPRDRFYLDFHKKHFPGGFRYWRVTNGKPDPSEKELYLPNEAERKTEEDADDFVSLVKKTIAGENTGTPPIIVAPYNAELFGHWWFEGVRWLEIVLDSFYDDPGIELATCGEYLETYPADAAAALHEGSWGDDGRHGIWLNQGTESSWRLVYETEDRLAASGNKTRSPELKRVFKQALREFMLLTASDWQFLISTWSARHYVGKRLEEHFDAVHRLLDIADRLASGGEMTAEDETYVAGLEAVDSLFPDVEPGWFTG